MPGFGDERAIYQGPTGGTNLGTGGSGLDLTLNGGLSVTANTEFSGVSAFNFTSNSHNLSGSSIITGEPFTFGCWVKPTTASRLGLLQVGSVTVSGQLHYISLDADLKTHASLWGSTDLYSSTTVARDQWYLIVLTFTSGKLMTIYHNGTSVASTTQPVGLAPTSTFQIGNIVGALFMRGLVDDVRIWNSVPASTYWSSWYSGGRGYAPSTGFTDFTPEMAGGITGAMAGGMAP